MQAVRLPWKSPNLNAFAERFVLSAKSECLRCLIPLGKGHLRKAVIEYLLHYHGERHHQGLDNKLIAPRPEEVEQAGPVRCRERLGGMLNFYYREAA